ncbi:MAG: PEP-CTERM sorting domain-containing protein [Acidobacteria bacterium]|nr:PEP-CTERM sorting domain-containing protein [Acidobacteriota bacterium]
MTRLFFTLLTFALTSVSMWGGVVLTMDEVSQQTVNGLTVSKNGYDFTFSSQVDAQYNFGGPPQALYLNGPAIVGQPNQDEVLEIVFGSPLDNFQFGFTLTFFGDVADAITVARYDERGNKVGEEKANAQKSLVFAEGLYKYKGAAVNSIKITFASPDTSQDPLNGFAIDNFAVDIPEPATVALAGAALALLALRRKSA